MNKFIRKRTRIVRLETNDNNLIKARLPKYTISIDKVVGLGIKDGKYIKQVDYTYYLPITYENLVNQLIAERYTIQDELAIQRKHSKGVNEAEFNEYDEFVEQCKIKAKQFIAERERVVNGAN